MVSDKPSSDSQKKRAGKKKANSPISVSEMAAGLRHQIDRRWPNLGRRLASFIRVSREKPGDIYSSGAQFVTEHKEAFEDRLAEKKLTPGPQAPLRSNRGPCPPDSARVRDAVKDGTVESSAVVCPSRRRARSQRNLFLKRNAACENISRFLSPPSPAKISSGGSFPFATHPPKATDKPDCSSERAPCSGSGFGTVRDIQISFPGADRIHIHSPALFSDAHSLFSPAVLERAFLAPEVESVEIEGSKQRAEIPSARANFVPRDRQKDFSPLFTKWRFQR